MPNLTRTTFLSLAIATGLALSPLALSHLNDKELPQSYRQSYFAIMGMNYGPMNAMVKGQIPWDEKQMAAFADQLATLMKLNVIRGFPDGSNKGTTRAKPEIWKNKADFEARMDELAEAISALQSVANEGTDRNAIAGEVTATGEVCKGCHDEYKSKDYLY